MLYRPDKRFHFVLTEATLRYRLCAPEVMLGQLDRLISFAALPNVRLGIVGFDTAYVVAPTHGFWLLDDDRVMVETFSAELNLAQPQEIDLYAGIFDQMAAVASYGRAARAIVTVSSTTLHQRNLRMACDFPSRLMGRLFLETLRNFLAIRAFRSYSPNEAPCIPGGRAEHLHYDLPAR